VVVGCSVLYFLMAQPLRITLAGGAEGKAAAAAVALAFVGFAVAALGDLQKSLTKAIRGSDHLVTGGIFRFLRHPNYTGEVFGWTASTVAAFCTGGAPVGLVAAALGWVGIMFVLAGEASIGLEKKQKDKYGGTPEYESWVKRSWAGPMFDPKGDN